MLGRKNDEAGSCTQSKTFAHKGDRKILTGAKSTQHIHWKEQHKQETFPRLSAHGEKPIVKAQSWRTMLRDVLQRSPQVSGISRSSLQISSVGTVLAVVVLYLQG